MEVVADSTLRMTVERLSMWWVAVCGAAVLPHGAYQNTGARASRVRCEIRRRSYWEAQTMALADISPAGVEVSRSKLAKCSAHPSRGLVPAAWRHP